MAVHRTSAPIWCAPSRHYDRQTNQPTNGHERSMSGPRGASKEVDKTKCILCLRNHSFYIFFPLKRWYNSLIIQPPWDAGLQSWNGISLCPLKPSETYIFLLLCVWERERKRDGEPEEKGRDSKIKYFAKGIIHVPERDVTMLSDFLSFSCHLIFMNHFFNMKRASAAGLFSLDHGCYNNIDIQSTPLLKKIARVMDIVVIWMFSQPIKEKKEGSWKSVCNLDVQSTTYVKN